MRPGIILTYHTLLMLDLNNVVVHTRLIQREGVANAGLGQAHVVVETPLDDLGVFLVVLLIDFRHVIAIYASWIGCRARPVRRFASVGISRIAREAHAVALENYCRIAPYTSVLAALYNHSRTVGRVLVNASKVGVGVIPCALCACAIKRRTRAIPLGIAAVQPELCGARGVKFYKFYT
jgi:hypothetical protein